MTPDRPDYPAPEDAWSVLTFHDWDGSGRLDTSLSAALSELDGVDEKSVLYDYVDTEAATEVLGIRSNGRGASEIRFPCEGYEIRVTRDGMISAR